MAVDVTGRRVLRALAVTLCFGTAALSNPAEAQFFGWNGWDNGGASGLPGPQVRQSIAEQGFRVLGPLRRNGNVFVADVIDRRGRHERLIVASADAQILQRFYVDDGRDPGLYARGEGADDGAGLVPPADIPGAPRPQLQRPRRYAEPPVAPAVPSRRYGDTDGGDGPDTAVVEPPAPRGQPPIRTVRPGSRTVERAPDTREPAAVESTPLVPAAPKPRAIEPSARIVAPKAAAPATVASRPEASPAAPASAATMPTAQRRLTDPLAIPGGPAKPADAAPVRAVSGVTGGPSPAPATSGGIPAAKSGEVSAAPLD